MLKAITCGFLIFFSCRAFPAVCDPDGSVVPKPGQEFPIFDGCGEDLDVEFQITVAEGYKIGAIHKAMADLPGLFKKYIPTGDPTLKYRRATFQSTGGFKGKLTVEGEKKWGLVWVDVKGYGSIAVTEKSCDSHTPGYSILFVPDPKFLPKIEDAFRRAEITICYLESAGGVALRATATMVAGAGFKYWVSHVAHGIVSPIIARIKPHALSGGLSGQPHFVDPFFNRGFFRRWYRGRVPRH